MITHVLESGMIHSLEQMILKLPPMFDMNAEGFKIMFVLRANKFLKRQN